jgi:hypothetical protein
MQRLSLKLMLLSTLLISVSCRNDFPSITPQVRCVNVFLDEKIIEGVPYYSGYCRCHLYEWSNSHIGRVSDSMDYQLRKCDKLIGFEPDSYAIIWTWWESIRLWLNRQKR